MASVPSAPDLATATEAPTQAHTDAETNDNDTNMDNTDNTADAAATATAPAAEEEGEDPLAQGLQTLLNPSIRMTSQTLSSLFLAQQELNGEIQRLTSGTTHSLIAGERADGNRLAAIPRSDRPARAAQHGGSPGRHTAAADQRQ